VGEVFAHRELLAVLPASEEEEIAGLRLDPVAGRRLDDLQLDSAPRAAALERDDVAPIAIEVHEVAVQVHEVQRHQFSQNGAT
jgi:hypothetical protein